MLVENSKNKNLSKFIIKGKSGKIYLIEKVT